MRAKLSEQDVMDRDRVDLLEAYRRVNGPPLGWEETKLRARRRPPTFWEKLQASKRGR